MRTKKFMSCICFALALLLVAGCGPAHADSESVVTIETTCETTYETETVDCTAVEEETTNDADEVIDPVVETPDISISEDIFLEEPLDEVEVPAPGQSPSVNAGKPNISETVKPDNSVASKPVETEPTESKPVETIPVESTPVVTEPVETEPVQTTPSEPEPEVTEPATPETPAVPDVCQHAWSVIHHPETGHDETFAVCKCGFTCRSSTEWGSHMMSFSAEDALLYHTSYGTVRKYVIDTEAYSEWICSKCGEVSSTQP